MQAHPDYVPSPATAYTYAMGVAAVTPALYSYAIAILPVSRTSSLLSCIGLSYEVLTLQHALWLHT
jgi:CBS-domain-containing membrane protein